MGEKVTRYKKSIISEECLTKLYELIETMRYGSVSLIIQDGVVVQIERSEKIRVK